MPSAIEPVATPGAWDLERIRAEFPALRRQINGRPAVFLDGPAGSQTPRVVIDAIVEYLVERNANHGGLFATSRESDAQLDRAHAATAAFLGADDPGEVAFGANMTSLTFALSRALARGWGPGDEVVVSRLDHDGNFTPWVRAAREAGAGLRTIEVDPRDGTLDLDSLRRALGPRTRLVAVGGASNALGAVNPVAEIVELAHRHGALVFIDAVHYAPHLLPDVKAWQCDFLVCSAYKFYGPHLGLLWGRRELLERLPAYKLRPAPHELPGRWMTGTQSHEAVAGTLAAVEYLASLESGSPRPAPGRQPAELRAALVRAYDRMARYEAAIGQRLLEGLQAIDAIQVRGVQDFSSGRRVPTFGFTHRGRRPQEIAARLAEEGIFVWHGNFYALPLTEALGLEPEGMVRVGLLHYNTPDEVDRVLAAIGSLA